jgi:hypothetical protein
VSRSDLDLEIDRLFMCMNHAEDPDVQANYCRRFTEAVNARNAQRTPDEIAELEQARGLR